MLQLFVEFVTPQPAVMVQTMGGDAVLKNERAMQEFVAAESSLSLGGRHVRGHPFDFAKLRQEIKDNPDNAIGKNAEFFNRKFDIHRRRQIAEDIARAVNREEDRIIAAVTAGPHD